MSSAVVLIQPKYAHNVGAAIRACSCFGIPDLRWTGARFTLDNRLPREERMKGYRDVKFEHADRPLDQFPVWAPIAVELHPGSSNLIDFEHPEHAIYVFGPEDGSIPPAIRRLCHRFLFIPSHHCLNLSAAGRNVLLLVSECLPFICFVGWLVFAAWNSVNQSVSAELSAGPSVTEVIDAYSSMLLPVCILAGISLVLVSVFARRY